MSHKTSANLFNLLWFIFSTSNHTTLSWHWNKTAWNVVVDRFCLLQFCSRQKRFQKRSSEVRVELLPPVRNRCKTLQTSQCAVKCMWLKISRQHAKSNNHDMILTLWSFSSVYLRFKVSHRRDLISTIITIQKPTFSLHLMRQDMLTTKLLNIKIVKLSITWHPFKSVRLLKGGKHGRRLCFFTVPLHNDM